MMLSAIIVSSLLAIGPTRADPTAPSRMPQYRAAVVIGARGAPAGRQPLRFAHEDAKAVARVLEELGGYGATDVRLLLDPKPKQVLATLDDALAKAGKSGSESMVLFYYSGHGDMASLYPNGEPLALSQLRQRLEDPRAQVRLGIIDACRGGGWTGAKGLKEVDKFNISVPLTLTGEGSMLIAASSGLQDAHESEELRGSFFTHHWNVALRGAGDEDGDGRVSAGEAFRYARARTIRDSAVQTGQLQNPSYSMNLRGRDEVLLTMVKRGSTLVSLEQNEGPLQLVHLDSGVMLLEAPEGKRRLVLAVPPGRYLVRRSRGGDVWTKELVVQAGASTEVSEEQLELVGRSLLAAKPGAGEGPMDVTPTAVEEPQEPPRRRDEIIVSFLYDAPGHVYHREYDRGDGVQNYLEGDYNEPVESWVAGYVLRTHERWSTKLQLGLATHQEIWSDGTGTGPVLPMGEALALRVGETYGVPLFPLKRSYPVLGSHLFEPYVTAQLTGLWNFSDWHRVNLGVAVGARISVFYAQVGAVLDVFPWHQTYADGTYWKGFPVPGTALELGLRFAL